MDSSARVSTEFRSNINNRRARYRQQALLEQPGARVEGINYETGRTMNRRRIEQLATCAFGNCAIDLDIKMLFVRIPDFLIEMEEAR